MRDTTFDPAECLSGFHRRGRFAAAGPTIAEIILAVRAAEPTGLAAVVVEPCCGRPLRAALACTGTSQVPTTAPGLAARLALWTRHIAAPHTTPVPSLLRAWLPVGTALVVPMAAPAWRAGALIVADVSAPPGRLVTLRAVAAELAVDLEQADRAWRRLSDQRSSACSHIREIVRSS